MCILLEFVVFCTSCCNSSHFFLNLNFLKLFLLGISMTILMDFGIFLRHHGKWRDKIFFLSSQLKQNKMLCIWGKFFEESEFIITGSHTDFGRKSSLKATTIDHHTRLLGWNFHTFILGERGENSKSLLCLATLSLRKCRYKIAFESDKKF